jgi:hypothetical protein
MKLPKVGYKKAGGCPKSTPKIASCCNSSTALMAALSTAVSKPLIDLNELDDAFR